LTEAERGRFSHVQRRLPERRVNRGRAGRALVLGAALACLLAAGAALAQRADRAPSGLPTVEARIGGERFVLEVAAHPADQYRGLGGRRRIDPHGGMLFVYPSPRRLAFVMRDCPVPIDVAFLDDDGRVLEVHEMTPEPPRGADESAARYEARLRVYASARPARWAVELAGGRFAALGVAPGDRIEIDAEALAAPGGSGARPARP